MPEPVQETYEVKSEDHELQAIYVMCACIERHLVLGTVNPTNSIQRVVAYITDKYKDASM